MPSERRGTVTEDVVGYIQRLRGTSEWRSDRAGNIRTPIAQVGFIFVSENGNFLFFGRCHFQLLTLKLMFVLSWILSNGQLAMQRTSTPQNAKSSRLEVLVLVSSQPNLDKP